MSKVAADKAREQSPFQQQVDETSEQLQRQAHSSSAQVNQQNAAVGDGASNNGNDREAGRGGEEEPSGSDHKPD